MARHDPKCLPSTRTLPRIRWPLQPRSHDRPTAFGALDDRWMTLSRHPGSWPVFHPVLLRSHVMKADSPVIDSLGRDVSSRRFRADRFTVPLLGHCSLVPPLFLERFVGAYSRPGRCLSTSATSHDVRTPSVDSRFLAGTKAMTSFLFLRVTRAFPSHLERAC